MKAIQNVFSKLMLSALVVIAMCSCEKEDTSPAVVDPNAPTTPPRETPFTEIPDELVGTWYGDRNDGPMNVNWDQGSFQGEVGFIEFRTMVFTKNGKNAVEYSSDVITLGDETKQYFYKMTGTLEYKSNPAQLTFHAQSGKMRIFSNKYTGYKEHDIIQKDVDNYESILVNPEATTFSTSTNYLNAKRVDGATQLTVKYIKAGSSTTPGGGNPNPSDPYSAPPSAGTYLQIGNQYYPTVTIGNLEWMSVNYAGVGGIKDSSKPQYGTYFKYADLDDIQIPTGWRIPTKQDYLALLKSQGIRFDEVWESTDGADLQSKKLLGQLMSTTGWLKQDGFANNKSGFNAVPANLQVTNGNPHGEGTNCLLWTSTLDAEENPVVFKIIQLPSDTYSSFSAYPVGFNPAHIPVRLVRNK
ncbi:FISUMP domain-containing protein [Pontibacter roseus]|uniref:FISUMP domain-containing protein n=1 Tax=Pontibacter roseus TaxID=336989 RepID=UPI00037340FA|nr:FISUMP domain-containing protein [Pontibacter roseus]